MNWKKLNLVIFFMLILCDNKFSLGAALGKKTTRETYIPGGPSIPKIKYPPLPMTPITITLPTIYFDIEQEYSNKVFKIKPNSKRVQINMIRDNNDLKRINIRHTSIFDTHEPMKISIPKGLGGTLRFIYSSYPDGNKEYLEEFYNGGNFNLSVSDKIGRSLWIVEIVINENKSRAKELIHESLGEIMPQELIKIIKEYY